MKFIEEKHKKLYSRPIRKRQISTLCFNYSYYR